MSFYKGSIHVLLICISLINLVNGQNTTKTAAPSTTMSAPTLSTTITNYPIFYSICDEPADPASQCQCRNNQITCYIYSLQAIPLLNANVEVMIPNFIANYAYFAYNNFGFLKKNETLPYNAKNLTVLYLESNKITEIEDRAFDKFGKLQSLSLAGNNLNKLTKNVLTKKLGATLTHLDLSNNNLSLSSTDFTNMVNLTFLNFAYNNDVGRTFATSSWIFPKSLSNLYDLRLYNCNISKIRENIFDNLSNLTILFLNQNPISSYPKFMNTLSALRHLDLSSSLISNLNKTALGENKFLYHLIIDSSEISSVEDCAFCGFTNLIKLYLNQNRKLSFIHENAFGYAKNVSSPKIEFIYIEACNLTKIPERLLDWKNVKQIGIGGNPFNCTCEMSWIIDEILNPTTISMNLKKATYYSYSEPFQCKYPIVYKNVPFYKIDKNYCKEKKHLPSSAESSTFSFKLLFILAGIFFVAIGIQICRYFLRLRKNKSLFNYTENIVNEDFDNNNA